MAIRSLTVNGKRVPVTYNDPQTPLLYVLRNELGLTWFPHVLLRVGRAPLTAASRRRRLVDVLHEDI